MAKEWDSLMKLLAHANPQDLVSFVLPGANYLSETFTDLQAQSREIQADVMYNVVWEGVEIILHIEFQRRHDEDMGRRVWEYNALATIIKQLPVFSFVIYLVKDHGIVQPPYRQAVHGKLIREFYYTNICLWQLSADVLKQPGLEGLWPLLPLTKDGARQAVVEEVITSLQEVHRENLLSLVYAFAALIFTQEGDRQWLQRRFEMLHDILEESWAYQQIKQKGLQQGLQEGLQQGLQQGLQEGLQQGLQQGRTEERLETQLRELRQERQTLTTYMEARFPELVVLLKAQSYEIEDPKILRHLLLELFRTQNKDEAERTILNAFQGEEDEG